MSEMHTQIHVKDGQMVVSQTQDCTAIAEWAKAQHNAGFVGSSEMRHAARIPDVFVEKYINDHNITFAEFMNNKEHIRRVLNDPAMAHFRVWKGRI